MNKLTLPAFNSYDLRFYFLIVITDSTKTNLTQGNKHIQSGKSVIKIPRKLSQKNCERPSALFSSKFFFKY